MSLLDDLKRHRAQMAPHHREREAGQLLLRSIVALEEREAALRDLLEAQRRHYCAQFYLGPNDPAVIAAGRLLDQTPGECKAVFTRNPPTP